MVRTSRNWKPQKVDEAATAVEKQAEPPVILRWQDLPPDDPGSRMIYIAPEDYMAPPGKNFSKLGFYDFDFRDFEELKDRWFEF